MATNRLAMGLFRSHGITTDRAGRASLDVIAADPKGWLLAQIVPEARLPAPLAALPSTMDDQLAFFRWINDYRKEANAAAAPNRADPPN